METSAALRTDMLRTGTSLQRDALALDEEIERRMGETARAAGPAGGGDAAAASGEFKQWKRNVGRLHDQISHQLQVRAV
jgi:hypothetical protein